MAGPPIAAAPPRWALTALLALTALVFLPTLGFGFVYDDTVLIVQNTMTHSLGNAAAFFSVGLWETTPMAVEEAAYYRPLLLLDLALDRLVFGLSPAGYHLENVLWHLLAVALAYRLAIGVGIGPWGALAAAAVFGLHPVQSEPVAYVASRNDVMAGALLLGGLLLLADDAVRPARLAGGAALLVAAGLTKEVALLAPLFLGAVLLARGSVGRGGRSGLAIAALASAAVVGLRLASGVGFPSGTGLGRLLEVTPPSLALYARELLLPLRIVPGQALTWLDSTPWWALGVGGAALGRLSWLGGRRALGGILLAGLALGPSMAAIARLAVVPDRYLYLPLAGLGLAVGAAVSGAVARGLRPAVVASGLLVATLVGAAWTSWGIQPWRDDDTLGQTMLARNENPHTWGGWAKRLEETGRLDEAAEAYARAVAPPTPYVHSCFNITAIHIKRGDPAGAVAAGERALANGCPRAPELVAPLALAYAATGRWAQARQAGSSVGRDPTGQAVLARFAADVALSRDRTALDAEAASGRGDPAALVAQVAFVLEQGGDPAGAAWVRGDAPDPSGTP